MVRRDRVLTIPNPHRGTSFRAVWGTDSDNVYVVGNQGSQGSIIHKQGSTWTPISIQPTPSTLRSIWGRATSEVYVVGLRTGALLTILEGSDANWTNVGGPSSFDLYGVGGSESAVYAVGQGRILERIAGEWSPMSTPPTRDLLGIAVVDSSSAPLETSAFAIGVNGTIWRHSFLR